MSRYQSPLLKLLRLSPHTSRPGPKLRQATSLSTSEDQYAYYDPKKYYPAHIGEVLSGRYYIVSKLGWGANSTVWPAKDISRFVQPHSFR